MNLTGITDLIARLQPIERAVRDPGTSALYGAVSAARPALMAALIRASNRPALVVTAHPAAAQELSRELAVWTGRDVALFPATEALPYERVRLDRAIASAREAVLRNLLAGSVGVVVAPVRALMQPIDLAVSGAQETVVHPGDQIPFQSLVGAWLDGGYAETALVEDVGTFARRGGVVDVFPSGAEWPVRIELFGNEVESLRHFDPATQRSLAPVGELRVPPVVGLDEERRLAALEALMDVDISGLNAEARTRWMDDLARLEAGASPDDLALFGVYFQQRPACLAAAFGDASTVVVDNADLVAQVAHDLFDQAASLHSELEQAGDLPSGLRSALLTPADVETAWGRLKVVETRMGTAPEGTGIDLSDLFAPAHPYAGRLRALLADLKASRNRTVIVSLQHERIADMLRQDDVPVAAQSNLTSLEDGGVTLVPGSLLEGWSLPGENLAILTDHELFGQARVRPVPRKPRAARETFFYDFSPGDHVVHIEHGIGRFEGMTRMVLDGTEREYALVQYAGADRVYVPTDQLERLTRYVGVGDSPPPLNKLGGGEWQRARTRAQQAAAEIARELIDLYAKRQARPGHAFELDTPWQQELESAFAYPETPDQVRAIEEVKRDMEQPHPMDRLVCADVGYGKTEVAVRAAFKAVMNGRQVAVLVPTTILAQQHFETFSERFGAFPIKIEALSRFRTPTEQRDILRRLATGEVDVVIGTHRLLQRDVQFKGLGLLIVDEEQRFGVKHKEQLKKLRETVDVLTLTATPIPRTLHMGLVGIREISVIETPPEGRLAIKTYLQPYEERLVRQAILRELDRDGQVYIVHNKVATIEAFAEQVRRLAPEARVLVGHGQMEESQLERVMLTFAHHEADVLVCSTIIENGLDIPNVNTIIVNGAHRLGLTQLYQLRGRVGRSANQAYAYLLYPRDTHLSHDAARRLEAVFEAQELGAGFSIAMKDLEIRGAGNLLGAQQSGHATAIGFDLYTRMIADAVETLRGLHVEEERLVTIALPLSMYLPKDYVGNEDERLALYRRIAAVADGQSLQAVREEMRDRFGTLPEPVENLLLSVQIKLLAREARLESIALGPDFLVVRAQPPGLYDRVSLYRRFGSEAKISTNVLRIPRRLLAEDWIEDIKAILADVVRLREAVGNRQVARA